MEPSEESTFYGPYTKASGLTNEVLFSGDVPQLRVTLLTKGLFVELFSWTKDNHKAENIFFEMLLRLLPSDLYEQFKNSKVAVMANVKRMRKRHQQFNRNHKRDELKKLEDQVYPTPKLKFPSQEDTADTHVIDETADSVPNDSFIPSESDAKTVAEEATPMEAVELKDKEKKLNLLNYEVEKKTKHLGNLEKSIAEKVQELNALTGHYNKCAVDKRDQRNKAKRKELETKACELDKKSKDEKRLRLELDSIKACLQLADDDLNSTTSGLKREVTRYKRLYQKAKRDGETKVRKERRLNKKLRSELASAHHAQHDNISTKAPELKDEDGSYSKGIRLCTLGLLANETPLHRVAGSIQTVSKHIFGIDMPISSLPNKSTVLNIADEGQYITKAFLADKLKNSSNFGVNKDGTSREKKKIMDTSITFSDGSVSSLGFRQIAREDANTVAETVKAEFAELASLDSEVSGGDSENYTLQILDKLSFLMSDRSATEKCTNKKLVDWCTTQLGNDTSKVHMFYCGAHVLLGFHSYTEKALLAHQKSVEESRGMFGKCTDAFLNRFAKGEAAERVIRMACEILGPRGDEKNGIRDKWEAYCREKNLKSRISSYRHNRFNNYFENALQVLHHRTDILECIRLSQSTNTKVKSVRMDLECPVVVTYVQALALFFVKVTCPYWQLINSDIPYLQLYKYLQPMYEYLKSCLADPVKLLQPGDAIPDFPLPEDDDTNANFHRCAFTSQFPAETDLLNASIKTIAGALLKTCDNQLDDFLNGQYSKPPSQEELQRTSFTSKTNVSCERHFGSLDASQRKRPSATLHHHSTVQMLKQNWQETSAWLTDLSTSEQDRLLQQARQGGSGLRKQHRLAEDSEKKKIQEMLLVTKATKVKEKKTQGKPTAKKRKRREANPSDVEFDYQFDATRTNEWVAVAYQENYFYGVVESVRSPEQADVKFMKPSATKGRHFWPVSDEICETQSTFVLKGNVTPPVPTAGGRFMQFDKLEDKSVSDLYTQYSSNFF